MLVMGYLKMPQSKFVNHRIRTNEYDLKDNISFFHCQYKKNRYFEFLNTTSLISL